LRNGRHLACAASVGIALAGLLAVAAPPTQAIPKPPPGAVAYNLSDVSCERTASYVRVKGTAASYLRKVPAKKGASVGAYQEVTLDIEAQSGYGGTLWKKMARTRDRTGSIPHSGAGLPQGLMVSVNDNYREGNLEFRLKLTVRVIRDVRPGFDTTAWKYTVTSPTLNCYESTDGVPQLVG
jgi:hypothetical protein